MSVLVAVLVAVGIILVVLYALAPLMLFVIYIRMGETNELLRWLGERSSASVATIPQGEKPATVMFRTLG